ncbi:MAG: amidohydrolase family protein [Bacteroidales bacterium]|nr:amidohydrolase family protein [Bacteroidales bacterium]
MRHFAANYIFDGKSLIKNSLITVDNSNNIIYVGKENEALIERPKMIFYNGILSPGFVNAHCHLELSDYEKTDEKEKGLSHFISNIISKRNSFNDNKKIETYDKIMFDNGINLVADIVNTDKTIDIKTRSSISYLNFIEISGTNDLTIDDKITYAENLILKFKSAGLSAFATLHAFYSASQKLYNYILNKSDNNILSIHFLESEEELNFFQGEHNSLYHYILSINPDFTKLVNNISNLFDLIDSFPDTATIILVHNVKTNKTNFKTDKNKYYCLCPASNLFLHNELPSSDFVYNNLDRIIVGTDSIASNTELDVFREIKILSQKYQDLKLIELLQMITSTASDALNNSEFGRFAVGTKPGIILINNIDLINLKIKDQSYITRIV